MNKLLALAALSWMAFIAACDRKDKTTPDDLAGGSVVENEVAGLIRYADGTPAADAEVKVYAVGYVPGPDGLPKRAAAQGPVFVTRTDAHGNYAVDSLPKGEYNILGRKDALYSYQDSLFVSGKPTKLAPDTLDAAGTMTGWVALQPNHNRQSVTVQALGTDTYANADIDGRFTLGPLAEGRYTLRVVTTEEKYTPLYASISVRTGRNDTLADTLRPVFTGIPVATGLQAVYDTLHAVVTVSWNRTRYPQFQEYQVFRNLRDDLTVATTPLARVTDTVFRDTLFAFGSGGLASGDSALLHLAYRVKVIDQSDQAGLTFGKAVVDAPSPFFVRPAITFTIANHPSGAPLREGVVSPGDSVRINAFFHDPKRRIAHVTWYEGGDSVHAADFNPPLGDGVASLFHRSGSPVMDSVKAVFADEAGTKWTTWATVRVVPDLLTVSLGSDTLIPRSGSIHLHAAAQYGFGRIIAYAWDIGKTGVFVPGSGPDTVFTAPAGFDHIPCIVRVTDDHGNTATATRNVDVSLEWRQVQVSLDPSLNVVTGAKAVEFQGRFWLIGGQARDAKDVYQDKLYLAASSDGVHWTRIDPSPGIAGRTQHAVVVFQDKLWILGGEGSGTSGQVLYSSDGESWSTATHTEYPGAGGSRVVAFQGRLWIIGGEANAPTMVWSSSDGATWTQETTNAPNIFYNAAAVHDGKIYLMGGSDPTTSGYRNDVWSSSDGLHWEKIAVNPPFGTLVQATAVDYGGFLWLLGGSSGGYSPLHPIWFSKDGVNWQAMDLSPSIRATGVDAPYSVPGAAVGVFQSGLWSLFGQEVGSYTSFYSGTVWRAR